MEIELLNQDIQNYLRKYTRFMSKKIYITKRMYDKFISSYEYIYTSAEESIINYDNDKYYKKLLDIKDRGMYALKIHNKRYLDELYDKYQDKLSNKLSKKEKLAILCEEDNVYVEVKDIKSSVDIIEEKVRYLKEYCNVASENICIVVEDEMREKFLDLGVYVNNYKEFGYMLDTSSKVVISDLERYKIISDYIKDVLYLDKVRFKKFYLVFKDKLFFNDDVMDFETFKDYHSYMFKRNLMDSKKSVSLWVKEYLVQRRGEFRSISLEEYDSGILVDIANCLFCSGVDYSFDRENNCFVVWNDNKSYRIYYVDDDENFRKNDGNDIYLYARYQDDTNACCHLVYELVKRRYPIEKKSYEQLYEIIKDNMLDGYFKEFVNMVVIPFIETINKMYYGNLELEKILEKLSGRVRDEFLVLLDFYKYFSFYLESHNLSDEVSFEQGLKRNINNAKYKYLIVLDDDYSEVFSEGRGIKLFSLRNKKNLAYSYLMSNVKLFCDFRKYLSCEKLIPIMDVYYEKDEIEKLACEFTKLNMDKVCNIYGETITKKGVKVFIYDDSKQGDCDINANYLLMNVVGWIKTMKKKKIMLMGRNKQDRNNLVVGDYFKISDNNRIICNEHLDKYLEYCSGDSEAISVYETGILIHPFDNKYGNKYDYNEEEVIKILKGDDGAFYEWERKLFYMAISRVKNDLWVIVPKSKVSYFVKNIANHCEVMVKKEVFVMER